MLYVREIAVPGNLLAGVSSVFAIRLSRAAAGAPGLGQGSPHSSTSRIESTSGRAFMLARPLRPRARRLVRTDGVYPSQINTRIVRSSSSELLPTSRQLCARSPSFDEYALQIPDYQTIGSYLTDLVRGFPLSGFRGQTLLRGCQSECDTGHVPVHEPGPGNINFILSLPK